jgi:hypothetical protein
MIENPFDLPLDIAAIVLPLAADVIEHATTAAGGKWGPTDYTPDIRSWLHPLGGCPPRNRPRPPRSRS